MPTTPWTGKGASRLPASSSLCGGRCAWGDRAAASREASELTTSPGGSAPAASFLSPLRRYPWGQEAFDKAKKENKLIFLSGKQKQGTFNTPEGADKPGCVRVVVQVRMLGADSPPARDGPVLSWPWL